MKKLALRFDTLVQEFASVNIGCKPDILAFVRVEPGLSIVSLGVWGKGLEICEIQYAWIR